MTAGGSDIEAIRLLKEDFISRGVDENVILDVGEDHVILSSEHKIRYGWVQRLPWDSLTSLQAWMAASPKINSSR